MWGFGFDKLVAALCVIICFIGHLLMHLKKNNLYRKIFTR